VRLRPRAIVGLLAFGGDPAWNRTRRVAHAGTFNANPLSAAAGIATLELVADGRLHAELNARSEEFRSALAAVFRKAGVPGTVHGEASIFHLALEGPPTVAGPRGPKNAGLYHRFRCALLLEGVDVSLYHGWVSAVHGAEDLERTVQAFARAVAALQDEGVW